MLPHDEQTAPVTRRRRPHNMTAAAEALSSGRRSGVFVG